MTVGFSPVPAIDAGPDLRSGIERWALSAPMRALVEAFDGDWTALTGSADGVFDCLSALDAFSDRWDTRGGKERNQAKTLLMNREQEQVAMEAADALGLRSLQAPRHEEYDHVVMLGGLVRACFIRPRHAAHLIRNGIVRTGAVTALGGHRAFNDDEFPVAAAAGYPDLAEEYEALDTGTRRAFGLTEPEHVEGEVSDVVGETWGIRRYRASDGTPVVVAAAPSSAPGTRRANTPDTLAWFAERFAPLRPGQRLLNVTSQIYVPAQHAAAIRMLVLPYKVEVETVGNDPQAVPPEFVQPFTATNYLQEVRTTIRALRDLQQAIDAGVS